MEPCEERTMEPSGMELNEDRTDDFPSCLSADYFQSFLRRRYPASDILVRNVTVFRINHRSPELLSFRVKVEFTFQSDVERKYFIVKFPRDNIASDCAGKHMLKRESIFLNKISHSMDKLLSQEIANKFASTLFEDDEESTIGTLVEDLSSLGYEIENWREGLDLEHSLAAMRYLAMFHAASTAILDEYESQLQAIPFHKECTPLKHDADSIKMSFYHIISELETWSDGNYFAKAVRKIGETLPQRLVESSKRQPDRFKVLVHGDATGRNILFKRGPDRQILSARFSHFEQLHVGSFAVDVNRFMNDSANDNVLLNHSKTLLEEYGKTLNDTLEKVGKSELMMSMEDINQELEAQKAVSQFAFFHVLPHARATCDSYSHADSELSLAHVFASPAYRKLLRIFLQRFDAKGWFDEYQQENKDWPVIMDIWAQIYCQS